LALLYRQLRNVYWRVAKPELYRLLEADRKRLRPFVWHGALAFDIGANRGDMAALYQDLGAKVVAVEPIPEVARLISRRFHVPVEQVAVGARRGVLTLRLGRQSTHSTLSTEYAETFPDRVTDRTLTVSVVTLDDLIARYGRPHFVKIDVEGFEEEVLRGLSHPVPSIVFEFQRSLIEQTRKCLAHLDRLGSYGFQVAKNLRYPEGSTPLWPSSPTSSARVLDYIRATLGAADYGDIYATLNTVG
jgi:FkbM family methyltransferase